MANAHALSPQLDRAQTHPIVPPTENLIAHDFGDPEATQASETSGISTGVALVLTSATRTAPPLGG